MPKNLKVLKIFLIFLIPFISINAQDTLFRSSKYAFRIKFPAFWEIKKGDGESIIIKATKDKESIIIGVKDLLSDKLLNAAKKENPILNNYTRDEIRKELKLDYTQDELLDLVNNMSMDTANVDNYKVEETGLSKLDNRDCATFIWTGTYSTLNVTFNYKQANFIIAHNCFLYILTGGSTSDKFEDFYSNKLLPCLRTFVFETWKENK